MRDEVTPELIGLFMREIARAARQDGRVYIAGGASALLRGWRETTVDIDVKLVPDDDALLRAIPDLKERLGINVELASPADFVPALPGWEDRSPFIDRFGIVSFHHFDFYTQCLSKLERAHRKDLDDAAAMVRDGLVQPGKLLEMFRVVEDDLYRYPAIHPPALRARVEAFALQ